MSLVLIDNRQGMRNIYKSGQSHKPSVLGFTQTTANFKKQQQQILNCTYTMLVDGHTASYEQNQRIAPTQKVRTDNI